MVKKTEGMKVSRLLYILGVLLMVYALIGGLQFRYFVSNDNTDFDASYSFKVGAFLLGVILIYFGRKKSN